MKVRHVFEEDDFSGGGHMIVRNSSKPGSDDVGFMASVAYKVGYIVGSKQLAKVSLTDGMILTYANEAKLIEVLNNDAHGYRPMTRKECIAVSKQVSNRWPKRGE